MKRLIILMPVIAILTFCMFEACKKETNPSRVVTISTPVISLNGPVDTTLSKGATWIDPGASWYDSVTGEKGTVTAVIIGPNYSLTNFVPNTNVDTVYLLSYIALNKNGFSSVPLTRGLGISNMGNSIDISGPYNDSNGGRDSIVKLGRALFYNSNVDLQGNPGVMVIKSDSTIAVATLYTADLTGAYVPEWFTQSSISYATPITFGYTPNVLNVPPGKPSAIGAPLGLPVTFTRANFPFPTGGTVIDSTRTKF